MRAVLLLLANISIFQFIFYFILLLLVYAVVSLLRSLGLIICASRLQLLGRSCEDAPNLVLCLVTTTVFYAFLKVLNYSLSYFCHSFFIFEPQRRNSLQRLAIFMRICMCVFAAKFMSVLFVCKYAYICLLVLCAF